MLRLRNSNQRLFTQKIRKFQILYRTAGRFFWTLHMNICSKMKKNIVPQYTEKLSMKSFCSQLLPWSTMVLYVPVWSIRVQYKILGSPTVHFIIQKKGQNKTREKWGEKQKWKKWIEIERWLKSLILHKLTHLCTNFVLVFWTPCMVSRGSTSHVSLEPIFMFSESGGPWEGGS